MLTTLSVAARRRVPSSTRLLSVSTPRHTRSDSLAPHPAHTLDSSNTDSMAHELQVEGDKVIERDEKGNIVSEKARSGLLILGARTLTTRTGAGLRPRDSRVQGRDAQPARLARAQEGASWRPDSAPPLLASHEPTELRDLLEHVQEAAEILHDLEKAHGDTPSAATSSSHKHGEGHKGRAPVEKHVSSSAHAEGGEHHAAAGSSSSAEHEEEVHRHRCVVSRLFELGVAPLGACRRSEAENDRSRTSTDTAALHPFAASSAASKPTSTATTARNRPRSRSARSSTRWARTPTEPLWVAVKKEAGNRLESSSLVVYRVPSPHSFLSALFNLDGIVVAFSSSLCISASVARVVRAKLEEKRAQQKLARSDAQGSPLSSSFAMTLIATTVSAFQYVSHCEGARRALTQHRRVCDGAKEDHKGVNVAGKVGRLAYHSYTSTGFFASRANAPQRTWERGRGGRGALTFSTRPSRRYTSCGGLPASPTSVPRTAESRFDPPAPRRVAASRHAAKTDPSRLG